ncbi:hypothetical protein BgiBS90_031585 [Biomphalaria glabrata]|nr:hypothetical protein BgiBS90_031585 [Biomphalaria glabrata]
MSRRKQSKPRHVGSDGLSLGDAGGPDELALGEDDGGDEGPLPSLRKRRLSSDTDRDEDERLNDAESNGKSEILKVLLVDYTHVIVHH